ncbi:MAG: uracil-DNA glycosylase [Candidatus Kerfeldbacteria bacterium]|nr:uracil-DNA glycosylase [Candidatus Kerfeldbacteria bacterium]
MDIKMEPSWKRALAGEFDQPYFMDLTKFVRADYQHTKVYPPPKQIFSAFDHCPFDKVKVVIIGQDPYHGSGQANGLCFSVADHVAIPPSLQNIYKEIHADVGLPIPTTGNLEHWADQGVLLLNATLTVRANQAGSHQGKGWEQFTDAVIKILSDQKSGLVFLLWGNYAKQKGAIIDRSKHHVLTAAHPSPFSANTGFFGCKHFSQTNTLLRAMGKEPIAWTPA